MDAYTVISSLQQHLAFMDGPLRALSSYGYSYHHLLIAAVIYWSGYTRIGGRLALGTMISCILFGACRYFFASPRPYWSHPGLFNGMVEQSYGMPSGHTQNATLFWGLTAYSLRNKWAWLAAGLLILSVGTSRLFLGVHYPLQVAFGLLLGLTLLFLFITFEQRVIDFFKSLPGWKKIVLTVFVTFLPLMFILIFREIFHINSSNSNPLPYSQFLRYNGLLTGCAIGLLFTAHATPSFQLFFTRAVPGVISVIAFWCYLPDLSELQSKPLLYYSARFSVFASLALWATWLWPLLHRRLHKQLCSRLNWL